MQLGLALFLLFFDEKAASRIAKTMRRADVDGLPCRRIYYAMSPLLLVQPPLVFATAPRRTRDAKSAVSDKISALRDILLIC